MGVAVPLGVAALAAGLCDCEVVLLAAGDAVPLVVGAVLEEDGAAKRSEAVLLLVATGGLLLDLRVEPTSLRKRLFI